MFGKNFFFQDWGKGGHFRVKKYKKYKKIQKNSKNSKKFKKISKNSKKAKDNQIARFFKLVCLLNRLTVFCNFLHDGRKPLGDETEYVLVVARGKLVGN